MDIISFAEGATGLALTKSVEENNRGELMNMHSENRLSGSTRVLRTQTSQSVHSTGRRLAPVGVVLLAALLLAPGALQSQELVADSGPNTPVTTSYDLSRDFSTNLNPAGVWSYGWKSNFDGNFTLYGYTMRQFNWLTPSGAYLDVWLRFANDQSDITHNSSGVTVYTQNGQGEHLPGDTVLWPGGNGRDDNYAAVRFAAPATGSYQIDVAVQNLIVGSMAGDSDFHVVYNGDELFGLNLARNTIGVTNRSGYTNNFVMKAGDTLDFLAGRGADGDFNGAALKLQATIALEGMPTTAPTITVHPTNQTVLSMSDVTFAVEAVGTAPLSYQWRFNGVNIPGATNKLLTLPWIRMTNAGRYSATVSNIASGVVSGEAILTVIPAGTVKFTNRDTTVTPRVDAPVSFAGPGPAPEGKINPVNFISTNGYLWGGANARAALYAGPAGSTEDQLAFIPPFVGFRTGVAAGYVNVGASTTWYVTNVTGQAPAVVQVRVWDTGNYEANTYEQAVVISQTRPIYLGKSQLIVIPALGCEDCVPILPPPSLLGLNAFNAVYTSTQTVSPVILTQPSNRNVNVGTDVTFTVSASGTAPLSYQWQFNGQEISGATNNSLLLTNVQASQSGTYSVVVSNVVGSVVSTGAVLSVTVPFYAGTLNFNNKDVAVSLDAPISYAGGGPVPEGRINGVTSVYQDGYIWGGTNTYAALYAGPIGSAEDELVLLGPLVRFRSGSTAGYVAVGINNTRVLTNVPAGAPALAQIRVWDAGVPVGSYESALAIGQTRPVYLGKSALLSIAALGGGVPPSPPAPLLGLSAFSMTYQGFVPPVLYAQPASQSLLQGATVQFSVQAGGTEPLSYQWQFNGSNIAGATSSLLLLSNVLPSQAGDYNVLVTNAYGSVLSSNATLSVISASVVYDLSRDFSTNLNPSGVWSYGWKSNYEGNFNLFEYSLRQFNWLTPNGAYLDVWLRFDNDQSAITHNNSDITVYTQDGQAEHLPGTVALWPGANGRDDNYAAARFTAPVPGIYFVSVAAQNLIIGWQAGDSDFHVVSNGVELFSQDLPTNTASSVSSATYVQRLQLAAGDTLDFLVGRGADGDFNGAGVKIRASVGLLERLNRVPLAQAGPDQVLECAGASTTVRLDGSGSEDPDGDSLAFTWREGEQLLGTNSVLSIGLGLGLHTITLEVRDSQGASSQDSLLANVVDTIPPVLNCPGNMTVEFGSELGTITTFAVTAVDMGSAIAFTCNPASGSQFRIGTTRVLCSSSDSSGNQASCAFEVTVLGPSGVVSTGLDAMIALRSEVSSPDDSKKLEDAIQHMSLALGTNLWADDTHLLPNGGDKVFNEAKAAVQTLLDLALSQTSRAAKPNVQALIDRITHAMRYLALIEVQDAATAGANPKKTAEDMTEITKGDEAVAAGKYAEGIDHYRHAWRHALHLRLKFVRLAGGPGQLQFVGQNGHTYLIQASSNLVDWTIIGTAKTNPEGMVEFVAPSGTGGSGRFYRALNSP